MVLVSCAPKSGSDSKIAPPAQVAVSDDGAVVERADGWLKLQAVSDDIIRVAFSRDRGFFEHPSLAVLPQTVQPVQVRADSSQLTLSTSRLKARLDLASGNITFLDADSKVLLTEKWRGLVPESVQGQNTFHVQQQWNSDADESLYGLGENQLGLTDIKGYDLDLWQHNGTIVVPLLVSSRGYGLFWDNPSFTRFGDLRPFEAIPTENLLDADGKPGGLTASYFSDPQFNGLRIRRAEEQIHIEGRRRPGAATTYPDLAARWLPFGQGSVRWEGSILAPATGDYQFQAFSDGQINVWIDGKMVMDYWRQSWLPWKELTRVHFEANRRYPIKVEWSRQGGSTIQLQWKTPGAESEPPISLWSEVGEGVDYYFINGPRIDDVIAGYRRLTGRAPMMPQWSFGLWQSRQRYETQGESLDVVAGFRNRGIPFDNIVQDWRYWPEGEWGSHQFDLDRFPDPKGWIDEIHRNHARLMISVWGKFYPGTENFRQLQKGGFLYPENLEEGVRDWLGYNYAFFDAFNPEARRLFWQQMLPTLFAKGVDAWWLDATEPDLLPRPTLDGQRTHMNPTALGPGARVLNAYPLMECSAIFEGQQKAAPNQRVFILSRSGFAGQQRFAAASWSGDTSSTWQAMRAQIAAGIGFCISGVPYWTMDVGGFSVPERFNGDSTTPEDFEEWCELNARWFEFGAFCPILRVHGEFPYREMWEFGGDSSPAFKAELRFDRLRYRLMPYINSLAGWVTLNDYTMMRGLAMDFPGDAVAREIKDQYMFGPAFLVNPVTAYRARSREVYLPAGAKWYDFWTDDSYSGGQVVTAEAPYDAIPIFIRAGSIVPMGPELQYTAEKPADPISLYVHLGADGDFGLYEDDGLTNAWQKGEFSLINLHWNDQSKVLTIGKRQGSFASMLPAREFDVFFVSEKAHSNFRDLPPKVVRYAGEAIDVRLSQ
ncbi:MAG: TIM-barrel domain-containing protein [Tepidisphaeraceae bacterium]|jgi:alpha-D-xyloside xylohydrolase